MEIAVDHRTPSLALPESRVGQPRGQRASALRDVLAELGERIKPVALARERTLPVAAPFDQLLPEGLIRGQVVSCRGVAARSTALGVVRDWLVGGGWMAVIDVATFGTDAAAEIGIPLERVVHIDTGVDTDDATDTDWIDVMGAAVDGFDVVLTRVPAGLRGDRRPAAVRKLVSRLHQKGAVVVTLGAAGALTADIEIDTRRSVWSGLGDGAGHLRRRVIDVEAGGRRMPTTRSCSIELVGEGARVAFTVQDADRDPQAELLAEMVESAESAEMAEMIETVETTGASGEVQVVDLRDRRLAG